ncbi:MAG: MoxR family ATPase [Euryarchaeota archaeon]|nr:MoxR family ATPase [Euryarchaeota archaeon]MDE1837273.1 MoxR family ATPase [Euryarchaeota archaeon]MDE1879943.1 MoxR family ATPase [Euryarchaeota archaeon]MDE2045123.1 MoxR family ATPase [Thermoplasmata archaeon]
MNGGSSKARLEAVLAGVGQVVVGKQEALRTLLVGLLADGHVLLEDLPGLGKTLVAKSFASVLGLNFTRVQFTADLLPTDITGGEVYDPSSGKFSFRRGPVFTHVLLADEINRAPPKVQSALLESMQEYQVTSEGQTYPLERPFLVMATQNPIELEGTYPLPEAQVDRFLLRLTLGYPTGAEERAILTRRREAKAELRPPPPVLAPGEFRQLQASVEGVALSPALEGYIVDLVSATRADPRVEVGASPRGSLALAKLARAKALLEGRDYALPDDVKGLALPALAHRLVIKPEPWIRGLRGTTVVSEVVRKMPVPKVN